MNLVKLSDLLDPQRVTVLEASDKKQAIERMATLLCQSISDLDFAELVEMLQARESIMSTGIGLGIAVPHARMRSVTRPALAVGISRQGIAYESLDDKPVHIVVLIVVPSESQKQYLRILARVTLLLKNAQLRRRLLDAKDATEVYQILSEY